MKDITKVENVNWLGKIKSTFKVLTGALVFSGIMLGGITLMDSNDALPALDFEDQSQDLDSTSNVQVNNSDNPVNADSNHELAEAQSNKSELFHRYGC